jgi:hypothetical protein
VNNLASIGWGTRIRSLSCRNYDSGIRAEKDGEERCGHDDFEPGYDRLAE